MIPSAAKFFSSLRSRLPIIAVLGVMLVGLVALIGFPIFGQLITERTPSEGQTNNTFVDPTPTATAVATNTTPPPPTRTPTATPTFTPTLPPCNYYKVDVEYEGDWGLGTQEAFRSGSDHSCISQNLTRAKAHCQGSDAGRGVNAFDDCVAMYLLGNAYYYYGLAALPSNYYVYSKKFGLDASIQGTCSGAYYWGLCASGTVYFNQSCAATTAPSGVMCSAAVWGWRASPLSLVWDDSHLTQNEEIQVAQFPLFSDPQKSWVVWKASKEMPLLVFDPEHTGIVSSGEQLFGSRSFGGKPGGGEWNDGFEALATLDKDNNGKIAGAELNALALWFDQNRDAVSQSGEVKLLSDPEVAVTAIYFKDTKKNEVNGDVIAPLGFERVMQSHTIQGPAVDWFTEGGASKDEVINKLMTTSRMNPHVASKREAEGSAPSTALKPQASIPSALNGLWSWETDDGKFKQHGKFKPQGFLTFSDSGDGVIRGHSYVETPYDPRETLKSQVDVVTFYGTSEKTKEGLRKLSFTIRPDGKAGNTTVSSTALFNEKEQTIRGSSDVEVIYDGKPARLSYTWVARRME